MFRECGSDLNDYLFDNNLCFEKFEILPSKIFSFYFFEFIKINLSKTGGG